MSIAARARTAAARAAPYPAFAGRFDEPAGYAMRVKLATTLACLLGIDPVQVTISDDTVRRYAGRYVWPLLEVTDPDDGQRYTFIREPGQDDTFLALGPCPECAAAVPVARIVHLADLGSVLGDAPGPASPARPGYGLPPEFEGDPGHDPACRYR